MESQRLRFSEPLFCGSGDAFPAGRSYGALRAEPEAGGRVIGNNDLWIAAHAKAAKLILVTNNEREFQRVSGLPWRRKFPDRHVGSSNN